MSVPRCTRTVATGPRPTSSCASITTPDAGALELALSSPTSATSKIMSMSSSRFSRCLAETSTTTVSPPQASGTRPWSASCFFTRSGLASGRSILLMATTMGTSAALAWLMASRV